MKPDIFTDWGTLLLMLPPLGVRRPGWGHLIWYIAVLYGSLVVFPPALLWPGLDLFSFDASALNIALALALHICLHEFSHACAAALHGVPPTGYALGLLEFRLVGMTILPENANLTLEQQAAITAAGPLCNLLLAGAGLLLARVGLCRDFGLVLAWIGIELFICNMLPLFRLDGQKFHKIFFNRRGVTLSARFWLATEGAALGAILIRLLPFGAALTAAVALCIVGAVLRRGSIGVLLECVGTPCLFVLLTLALPREFWNLEVWIVPLHIPLLALCFAPVTEMILAVVLLPQCGLVREKERKSARYNRMIRHTNRKEGSHDTHHLQNR